MKGGQPNHMDLFDLTSFGCLYAARDYSIDFRDPWSIASEVVQDVPMRTAYTETGRQN